MKKERKCRPSCCCQFCTNTTKIQTDTTTHADLLVNELLHEEEEVYIDDSNDDDLMEWQQEEMNDDEELRNIKDFVFGTKSDEEYS